MSVYNFEAANVASLWKQLDLHEAECQALVDGYAAVARQGEVEKKRYPLLGAYEQCLKCSHLFNLLDARGAISVTERVGVIARIRTLAVGVAKAWVEQQQAGVAEAEAVGTAR